MPAQLLFTTKTNGDRKCRYVARGDLMHEGVHYVARKSFMAAIGTVRMQVPPTAAAGRTLYATDFSMAFAAVKSRVTSRYT